MIKPYAAPGDTKSTHDIVLSDGVETVGIVLAGGVKAIKEDPSSPSTLQYTSGGTRYGDFEPQFSHIDQRDWVGGRGGEDYVNDNTMFYDNHNGWSLTPGKYMNGLQWKFAKGLRNEDSWLSASKSWKALLSTSMYMASSFTASASYSADKVYLWIRRRGNPGTLTVTLRDTDKVVLKTATITTTTVTDTVSVFQAFDWDGTQALTASTAYWICAQGASTDNATNHWEVAVDTATTNSYISSAGVTWAATTYEMNFRVVDVDIARRFWLFKLEGAFYAVDSKDDGTASQLYINGTRGTATAGSGTSLTDSNNAFGTTKYVGARVTIIAGTGAGQDRAIVSHTNTVLTVATWSVIPDNSSRYVIYDTPYWTEIATTGLGKVVQRPAVAGKIAFFPQGQSVNIRVMRNNATAHNFAADGTNKADFLYTFYSTSDKAPVIWRANNTAISISKSAVPAWGAACVFGTAILVGDIGQLITNLYDVNNTMKVYKEDSIWYVSSDNLSVVRMNLSFDAMPSLFNGAAVTTKDLVEYFSYSHSVEYMNGGNIADFGPWKGAGMPDGRQGPVSALCPGVSVLFGAVDGLTGTSSVLAWNDFGWTELMRAWEANKRIRDLKWQPVENGRPKLWIDCGGELVYLDFPKNTLQPQRDDGIDFQHESTVTSQTIDMGFAGLPKFYKEIAIYSEKMAQGMEVGVDYQTDEYVDTNTWTPSESIYASDINSDTSVINLGNKRKLRYRLRINTNNSHISPALLSVIVKGFARTPVKRQWALKVKISDMGQVNGQKDMDADSFYDWLWKACQTAGGIRMTSTMENMHNIWVIVEPPTILRNFFQKLSKIWGGDVYVLLREA
jgi:hypothetical protein